MFCLFDKCSRTFKAAQVLNNKKDNFQCKLHFMIGDKNYYIKRVATKEKKGNVKVNVDFWYEENGDLVSLNGEDRDTTNYAIRRDRGLYDFRVTVSSSTEDLDKNQLVGKIYIKPTKALEFIDIEFLITPTGASFDNI